VLLRRGERYRIYPTTEQVARIEVWEHALRWLWNHSHSERVAKLEHGYLQPSSFDQQLDLTALRRTVSWLADVPRDVSAQMLAELDKAWQRGFTKLTRMPRFKRKSRGERAPLIAPKAFRVEGRGRRGAVAFPKLGTIRAVVHRPVRGRAKTCAIVRDGAQWYAAISWELEVPDPQPSSKPAVGIDRGVVNLVADSDGRFVESPRTFKRIKTRLATAQRRVARKRKGSKNQKRARKRVALLHQRSRRQRAAVLHRESARYAKSHGTLVVERLDIGNMTASARGTVATPGTNVVQKTGLNRAILDGGWGRFVQMLRYKTEPLGGRVVEVHAAYSSRECAACGHVAAENRPSPSKFECVACGHRDHADTNAAKVILRRGTHGAEGFGGDGIARPAKKQLRVARRATRHVDPGLLSAVKAPA
jgi:putative transposase